jgi:hypothetical protein
MTRAKGSKRKGRAKTRIAMPTPSLSALRRRLARLLVARDAERQRHARALARLRRSHDRRLVGMLREIAQLRHHEARVEALTRLLAEREAALATQATRVAELESRLPLSSEIT